MRILPMAPVLTVLILAACGGGSSTLDTTLEVDESTPDFLLARFAGATFVAVATDQADPESASGVGSVSFTND